jgi:hypothetical protein
MTRLHRGPVQPVAVRDVGQAGLAFGPQIQVVLEQEAQQLTAVGVEALLQLAVVEGGRPATVEEADQFLEVRPAAGEAILIGTQLHRSSSRRGASAPPVIPTASTL